MDMFGRSQMGHIDWIQRGEAGTLQGEGAYELPPSLGLPGGLIVEDYTAATNHPGPTRDLLSWLVLATIAVAGVALLAGVFWPQPAPATRSLLLTQLVLFAVVALTSSDERPRSL